MSTPNTSESSAVADQARWFTEEVQLHDAQLKAYLRGSFPTLRDVDDVVQESYFRIWRARATQTIHSAKGFLFTLARHIALDAKRRERASPLAAVADLATLSAPEDRPSAAELIEQQEKIRLLAKALALLPDRTREIVVLRKLHGVPQKEVAGRLGLSEAAVEHHVARGLKRCESYLKKAGLANLYDRASR